MGEVLSSFLVEEEERPSALKIKYSVLWWGDDSTDLVRACICTFSNLVPAGYIAYASCRVSESIPSRLSHVAEKKQCNSG